MLLVEVVMTFEPSVKFQREFGTLALTRSTLSIFLIGDVR
jgi:hypothetical protein